MMNINGSGINQNNNVSAGITSGSQTGNTTQTNNSAQTSGSSASQAVLKEIQNLLAGDTFSGEVSSVSGSQVTLKLTGGALLNATLQNNAAIGVGENLTFLVSEHSGSTITLKPITMMEQSDFITQKALEAAGLAPTDENQAMVKELLNQSMSISSETLNELSKAIAQNPDANLDTLVRLYKLEIPITPENIQQFEAYKSYESSISNDLNALASGLGEYLANQAATAPAEAGNTAAQLMDILYHTAVGEQASKEMASPEATNTGTGNALIQPDGAQSNGAVSENIGKFLTKEDCAQLLSQLSQSFPEGVSKELAAQIQNGTLSAKELLDMLSQWMKQPESNPEQLPKLLKSDEFGKLMNMAVRENMRIAPEDVKEKNGISNFYKRVQEDAERLTRTLKGDDGAVSKSLNNLRNNMEFMNDLNRNMTFFQMPLRFSEQNANGELYVFTNKKSLKNNPDNISALLHLDMENLGPLDIFVKMSAGRNVSTNFCLENEEMLDFISAHIDQLNDRLTALGYHMSFEMTVKEDASKPLDFVEDFLDFDAPEIPVPTRLTFDHKA